MTISARLGSAIAAGVPVLVLVSMGPVAGLSGAPSVAVWAVAAFVGFLMALFFAELASAFPGVNGGVAAVSAAVLRPRSRVLARVCQWSYWLGWSPALAINGLLVGTYLQRLLLPESPSWLAVLLASVILSGCIAVNHLGMQVGGRLQAVLVSCVAVTIAVLFIGALDRGAVNLGNFRPFAPPGGWSSRDGWLAIAGSLFIAGWSAYGAELALNYSTRYRSGVRDAVRVLMTVATASLVAYAMVPFLLIATVGVTVMRQDPAAAFTALSAQSIPVATGVVLAVLTLALLLGLNMMIIASSWTLHQMACSGEAWSFLRRLNRHGMPGNAMRFDLAVNFGLLLLITALAGGDTAEVPIALLAAANVGYFVSMSIALIAARLNHRRGRSRGVVRLRPGLIRIIPVLVCFNLALLATGGYAWGWRNVAIGALVLTTAVVLVTWRTGRATAAKPAAVLPACWGRAEALVPARLVPEEIARRDAL